MVCHVYREVVGTAMQDTAAVDSEDIALSEPELVKDRSRSSSSSSGTHSQLRSQSPVRERSTERENRSRSASSRSRSRSRSSSSSRSRSDEQRSRSPYREGKKVSRNDDDDRSAAVEAQHSFSNEDDTYRTSKNVSQIFISYWLICSRL